LFAHGSGSGRESPRNQFVARALQKSGLGTLLLDLLTDAEAQDAFDIGLLANRLRATADWLGQRDDLHNAPIGYFGASTGAGLVAAADSPQAIGVVVSRGGRPDRAGDRLDFHQVDDKEVQELLQRAPI
jgi:putative phosphoribosyl transferase